MRLWLSTYGSHGSHGSHGDVDPMVGLTVQLRALQARGAEMPVRAPADFAELLARVGVPLVLVVPVGQPVRPLVTRVTGATPPSAADLPRRPAELAAAVAEGCDALVASGVMPAGVWL